jgi:site-specific DNA-methyltransferase (adenine-specific)
MEINKIYNIDCMELMSDIPDSSIDFVLTDIPYNISRENNFKTMKDRTGRNGIDFGEWDKDFDEKQLKHIVPKIKKGGGLFTFHEPQQFPVIRNLLDELTFKDMLVWQKTNPMPRNRDRRYISNIEMASWYVKEGLPWVFHRQNDNYDGCVFLYPSESGGGYKRYHPCQKNVKMLESIIIRHTNEGDIVFDPYAGSGSTCVAALNTNRRFIGCEIDTAYCDIAIKRIQDVVSKSA